MARIISIVNQKGGTGKSACTANLAVGLAQKNMKVLIVDADPQSDVSAGFGYRDCDDSNETLTVDKLIATIRSREISASIILQSQSQLKAMYKDSADTILGNCDTTLFLGGKEKTTLKEMSELLGKETIDLYNTSETRSNQKSFGLNYQKTGKQLMTEDEIAVMDGGKCILQIRGARPFFSDKYDITKHKNYRLLADENEKNRYKVEKELNPQYTPKSEEEVEVIHVELSE